VKNNRRKHAAGTRSLENVPHPIFGKMAPQVVVKTTMQVAHSYVWRRMAASLYEGHHAYHEAFLGLLLPQAPSSPDVPTMCEVEGSGRRGSALVAIPRCRESGVFSVVIAMRGPTR